MQYQFLHMSEKPITVNLIQCDAALAVTSAIKNILHEAV